MTSVSVIIPTYNRADVLPRAIRSVLSQTYDDFELIIVDDASTDDTRDVVAEFTDDRIRYVCLSENQGANKARNCGISVASGNFISFLDSDDEYLSHRLEKTVNVLKQVSTKVGGVFHSYKYVDGNEVTNVSIAPEKRIYLEDMRSENLIGGISCTMFRSEALESVNGLDESLPSSQDYDLYIRILISNDMIGVSDILSKYYVDQDGIRNDYQAICEGQDRLVEKHGEILSDKRISRHHYNRAFYHANNEQMSSTRQELRRAISIYSWDPLYYYHYLSTFGGTPVFNLTKSFKIKVKKALSGLRTAK